MKHTQRPYTFSNFDVDDSNRAAFESALHFAEHADSRPLLITGCSWCGKTHLLEAVKNRIAELEPALLVIHTDDYNICRQLFCAARDGDDFSEQLLSADVLLVDELSSFQGKGATQEEFIKLLTKLHQTGKRIMLTCSDGLSQLDPRLCEVGFFGNFVRITK